MGHVEIFIALGCLRRTTLERKLITKPTTKTYYQKKQKNKLSNYQIIHILYTLKTIKNKKAHTLSINTKHNFHPQF
jgi:hypothetical protein